MKIIILILLFSSNTYAGSWIDIENINTSDSYWTKNLCEQRTGNTCGECLDRRRCMKGLINDLGRPILRPLKNSPILLDCNDFNDCSSKGNNPDGDTGTNDSVCLADNSQPKWDKLVNHPDITSLTGPWFIWCEKGMGSFRKKNVIIRDVAGSISADLADKKIKKDKLTRKVRKKERDIKLVKCEAASRLNTMTPKQFTVCIRILILERLGTRIKVENL